MKTPLHCLRPLLIAFLVVAAGGLTLCLARRPPAPPDPTPSAALPAGPSPTWPWPQAAEETLPGDVRHWRDESAPDGTTLDLFRYDFAANPRLRLELYDQDEDDATPGDGRVPDYWQHGAAQVLRHLQATHDGSILAVWNGLFFNSNASDRRGAAHVAPVVLRGEVRYFVGNHRWTFGVKYDDDGRPTFQILHRPDRATLAREFTFAAAGAQGLLKEGQPLRLQPLPQPGDPPHPRPVPSTSHEAGYIPGIDHIRTARTSFGWSRDSRQFYLLIVKEPDSESESFRRWRRGEPQTGGWDLAQLQQFWRALRVWEAVNIDGGDVTQLAYRRADSRVLLIPPRWDSAENHLLLPSDLSTKVEGGTLMYFYVRTTIPPPHPSPAIPGPTKTTPNAQPADGR